MADSRMKKLAKLLVDYSVKVKPGDWVYISAEKVAEPFVNLVLEEVLKAGGNPTVQLGSDMLRETIMNFSDDTQLSWVSPVQKLVIEQADVMINISASSNTRTLAAVDPKKQQIMGKANSEISKIYMNRSADGSLRWVITQFPCNALAQEADMSLRDFEDFVYGATFADQDDPIAKWTEISDEHEKMIAWLDGKKEVKVKSKHADLTLSIDGRKFINSAGTNNMPSGEIFTSPVEDSVNGWIYFTYPAITGGREVEGIRLEFENGKVVKASAEKNEDYLMKMLDMDEGSRTLGEFAIGTNYGIQKFTKSILFDEKIGGSIHLAIGAGFPEAGSKNVSAVHWDMICDMKTDSEILVDGELFYKNGKFVV